MNNQTRSPRRVLVIAPHSSYRTSPFIEAAHKLGVKVLIASQGKHSIVSEYAQGLHIDLQRPDEALNIILEEAGHTPFAGIIGTDDTTIELAAAAARQLGLPHNDPAAVKISRRKDLARDCLDRAGVKKPSHLHLHLQRDIEQQIQHFSFPAVVKPVALAASRGVIRVDTPAELQQACHRIERMLACEPGLEDRARQQLLLEAYIGGTEVAVEGMLYDGELELLAVFDKPDPMEGPFFEETYYITPSGLDAAVVNKLQRTIQQACQAYGLEQGPVHAECRINEQGIWILEVAGRTIGGLCGRLLQFGTGYSLEELVLAHAMGCRLTHQPHEQAAGVLMIPIHKAGILKRVEGILAAQAVPFIEEITIQIREGYELHPLPEGASYLGFIFAEAPSPEQVEIALRQAHACLNIVVAPLLKVKVA